MQARGVGLQDGADGGRDPEGCEFGSVVDDVDLDRELRGVRVQGRDGASGGREGVGRVVGVAAAVGEASEVAGDGEGWGLDEGGEEVEIAELELRAGDGGGVEEGLAVAAVLVGKCRCKYGCQCGRGGRGLGGLTVGEVMR